MSQQKDQPNENGSDGRNEGRANGNGNPNSEKERKGFPIVAIGSSAGGLEALKELFSHVPDNTDIAFVVVTHQHPGHESVLPELLQRETNIPVKGIEDDTEVCPDHVYVLGPGKNVTIEHGRLRLSSADHRRGRDMPIDLFFRSLAGDMHERAIAVILSGTGTDGTLGIKEIKAHGGMIIIQDPSSAHYAGMPTSARNTGMVDFVVQSSAIPETLINYLKGPYLQPKERRSEEKSFPIEKLESILRFIRARTGHDFSSYKQSTIRRRIQRRMSVHGLKEPQEYLDFLHENRQEAQLLFSELLISVTSFFRDPEAFKVLKEEYLTELVRSRPDNYEFRVWIPGCATGEEAYSIAIILAEIKKTLKKSLSIRVFGTDLDDKAIQRARQGAYPASITVDVSPERLEQYFTREGDDAYAVRKDIRDTLVFAPQNVLNDPPFLKLDLLVCRNLLIYLQQDQQKLLLPTFHYALNPGGLLFLGSSESVGGQSEIFETLDTRWKIYRRKEVPTEMPHLPAKPGRHEAEARAEKEQPTMPRPPRTNRLIERLLLNRFAPVSIIIDRQATIVYIHGRTGTFLEPEQQNPRNNILDMAREGLRLPLSAAFHQAQ
ncbi:MAG: hypothetical protein GF344_18230, partial [Chitinivibrionales bacterium]|nr:hypothetical protein [Chitinivibrionales bacterium]MBD3358596.1 hypothetical protein [Chitinivibrionales bacterium]